MGQTRITLDPTGYVRAVEEGYNDLYDGGELFELFTQKEAATAGQPNTFTGTAGFWSPPGSGMILCEPRQFDPLWYRDSRLDQHVLQKSLWKWAAGVTVDEWNPTTPIIGTSYPKNKWLNVYVSGSAGTLDSTNYTTLFGAAGVTLPANMKTVGMCATAPVGGGLGTDGTQHFTPFVQLYQYPDPAPPICFGWANMCLLFTRDRAHLLRSPNGSKQTWEALGSWGRVNYLSTIKTPTAYHDLGLQEDGERVRITAALVAEVGDSSYFVHFSNGQAHEVKLRKSPGLGVWEEYILPGAWWIGAAQNSKVQGQFQVTGYEVATSPAGSNLTAADGRRLLFDLGAYKPTVTPGALPTYVLHLATAGGATVTPASATAGTVESDFSGETIQWALLDYLTGDPWASDGTRAQGSLYLKLTPKTPGGLNGAYLSPQVQHYEIRFATIWEERVSNPFYLYDAQYDSVEGEASYFQPEDAGFSVLLREEAVLTLEDEGFDERFHFPVHLEENIALSGPPNWVLRAAAWVESLALDEEKIESDTDDGLRVWRLRAKGLLSRADRKWRFQPRIVNPAGSGLIEHTFAATQALAQASFEVTDPNVYEYFPERALPVKWLPGTWGRFSGRPSDKKADVWGPTWDETKLAYAQRLATTWANYVLYSTLAGKVWYHPNLLLQLADRIDRYYPAVVLYKNAANATAAGGGVTSRQVYTRAGKQLVIPKGNWVTIRGVDEDEKPIQKSDYDPATITTLANPNFSGEEEADIIAYRMAVGEEALTVLARQRLKRIKRKRIIRPFYLEMAPWDLVGIDDFDVGKVFTAEDRGDFVAIHVKWKLLSRDVWESVLTGERVPDNALLGIGIGAGNYPGQGFVA